jgi:YD repeat-containing protein
MRSSRAFRILGTAGVLAVVLCLAGCGGARQPTVPTLQLAPGETAGPVPTHDPSRQAVAVAYLEPETELGVDVISGKLYMAAERFFHGEGLPGEHEGLIGLVDPQAGHRMFAYRSGGIPGQPGWDGKWGDAPAPAPGRLTAWVAPRLVSRASKPVTVVLADGQRVGLGTDAGGRIVRVRWATPRGEPLLTTIRYQPGATTISAPAGVVRTYRYDTSGKITEVDAPGAAATAHHDTADGYLDSKATAGLLAYRLRSGTAERYAAYEAAPKAISANSFAERAVGGHQTYGVRSLRWMRVVDAALRKAGVLDVAEAIPTYNDYIEDYSQEKQFEMVTDGLRGGCDLEVRWYAYTYGQDTTRTEIATIASRLAHGPDRWIYIYYANRHRLGCARAL